MKKVLFALMLLGSSYSTIAQTAPAPATEKRTEEYCMMLATAKLMSTKVTISIDQGQAQKFFSDKRYKDEAGNVQNFNSVIDALNYLNGQGWEFVNAYAITVGGQNVYHYVMRRRIAS